MKHSIFFPNAIEDTIRLYAKENNLSFSRAIQQIVIDWAETFQGKKWVPPQEGRFENAS